MEVGLLINFILAAIVIAFFIQLLVQKKHAQSEIRSQENHLTREIESYKKLELQYQNEINLLKTASSAIKEIENLRKEKESETKLRVEAEKQVELALQKNEDVQKEIEDWKNIQESNLQDATDAIEKMGDDLYENLAEHQRSENEELISKFEEKIKDVYEYLAKIDQQLQHILHKNPTPENTKNSIAEDDVVATSQKLLENVLKAADLKPEVDYFMKHNLPEMAKKSVPCEAMIVLNQDSAVIIDIKSTKFFAELFLSRKKNLANADDLFRQKIDRYLAYLTNPKYQSNIIKYFSKNGVIASDIQHVLIMLVPSQNEIDEFNKLGDDYLKILDDNHILLHSLKSFEEIIA